MGKYCRDCSHFCQHYILDGDKYHWVNCGHCVYARPVPRARFGRICKNYEAREGASGQDRGQS